MIAALLQSGGLDIGCRLMGPYEGAAISLPPAK